MSGAEPPAVRPSAPASASRGTGGSTGIRIGAVAALAVAAAFVAWLLIDRNDDTTTTQPAVRVATVRRSALARTATIAGATPVIQTPAQLRAESSASSVPLYWAGPQPNTRLEVTHTPTGRIFIRYLPPGSAVGDNRPLLTVATYAEKNGYAQVRAASRNKATKLIRLAGGGIAIYDPATPTNLHLAYPGQPYQIEVFDPQAKVAQELVSSGAIRPVN